MEAWISVMDCPTKFSYEDHLTKFEVVCAPWHKFVAYGKDTWLIPHKEKFVKAWTDNVMHLGNTITNKYLTYNLWFIKLVFVYNVPFIGTFVSNLFFRVKSTHWALKQLLRTSMEDLCKCFDV